MAPALAQPPLPIALVVNVDVTASDEELRRACLGNSERAISPGKYKDGDPADTPRDLSKDMQCYWDAEVCKFPEHVVSLFPQSVYSNILFGRLRSSGTF
jgi:hypothetical protein